MIKNILRNGSSFLAKKQATILSAATVVAIAVAISRFLGLFRNRILAGCFSAETLSVYFAAFRLPEVFFEVLVFGALSSAFIPTFTSYLSKNKDKEAWYVAAVSLNIAFCFFLLLSIVIFIFAKPIYRVIAPGFGPSQIDQVVILTRILLAAQAFFVLSYFLTGMLESLQRFIVPAIAPIFYNLGIILGSVLFSKSWGIYAPTFGAVLGAFMHFAIQLPLAWHLGFRPKISFDFKNKGVREIGKLALPRFVELSFIQFTKSAELFLSSLVSQAAYTYYTFAFSLQLVPISLFGMSIAKASLPSLSYESARGNVARFRQLFISSFNEILFLVLPCSIYLLVMRIPLTRLAFGADRFGWVSTLETSYALSAFAFGVIPYSLIYLLSRAFYAFHDTKKPVVVSVITIFINIALGALFIMHFKTPIWGLAASFSIAYYLQAIILFILLEKKIGHFKVGEIAIPFFKMLLSGLVSGMLMFFSLKLFDLSVWGKRLSFLSTNALTLPETLEKYTLDTRYTINLILLMGIVTIIGGVSYLAVAKLLRIREVNLFERFLFYRKKLKPIEEGPANKEEPITITSE